MAANPNADLNAINIDDHFVLMEHYGIDLHFVDGHHVPMLLNFMQWVGNRLSFKNADAPLSVKGEAYFALSELLDSHLLVHNNPILTIIDHADRRKDALKLIKKIKKHMEGEWLNTLEQTILGNNANTSKCLDRCNLRMKQFEFQAVELRLKLLALQDKMAELQQKKEDIVAARNYVATFPFVG